MANQWFKFYGAEFLGDPKIGRLSSAERSCWVTLLCMGSQTDGVIEYLSVDDLLEKSGIKWNPYSEGGDWENCQSILVKFSNMKMIKVSTDASRIEIINWEKRQEYTMTSTERSRKHREKLKEERDMQRNATQCNENATLEENRIEENRYNISSKKVTKKEKLNSSYEDKFENWWKIYPRKVGKGNAYETWVLLEENIKDTCLVAIQNQVDNNHFYYDWVNGGKGGHNPPHPTTWLNQKRWDDTVVKKVIKGDSKNVLVDDHSQKLIDNMKNKTIKLN